LRAGRFQLTCLISMPYDTRRGAKSAKRIGSGNSLGLSSMCTCIQHRTSAAVIAAWKSAADIRSSRAISCTVSLGFWIRRAAPPARFPTSARGEPSDSRPCEDLGRTFDLAARFNHGASEPGLKCLGRNRLFRHDPHLDKLRPNASHRLRDPCVEGRAFTAANQNFAEEIRNRQPGVRKVLDQPIG
jgi:hypothetical protein